MTSRSKLGLGLDFGFGLGLSLALLLTAESAHAELYKWVAADGKVTYSDVPPPANAKRVATKIAVGNSASDISTLPQELAAAVNLNPVTLYTSLECVPCNEGRKFLKSNGIPFSEKIVSSDEDIDKLKSLSGETTLPLMTIRNVKFRGLSLTQWRTALSNAGYPETSQLPKEYRYAAAEPLTTGTPKQATERKQNAPRPAPAPAADTEPKIRF